MQELGNQNDAIAAPPSAHTTVAAPRGEGRRASSTGNMEAVDIPERNVTPTNSSNDSAPPLSPPAKGTRYTLGEFDVGRTIGTGSFSRVRLGTHQVTGDVVAIKIVETAELQKCDLMNQFHREMELVSTLRHPRIVVVKQKMASRNHFYIVMEHMAGGELLGQIFSHGKLVESTARRYFIQMMEGIKYCHSRGVAHRDIKPENLLLDAEGNLKISDFGLANIYMGTNSAMHTRCGTPEYAAPELLVPCEQGYNGKMVDVWSCGVVLFQMITGDRPFDEYSCERLYAKILKSKLPKGYQQRMSPAAASLINRMLTVDPSERITVDEIFDHPWVSLSGDDEK